MRKRMEEWWKLVRSEAEEFKCVGVGHLKSYWIAICNNSINLYICRLRGHNWFSINGLLITYGHIGRYCHRCGLIQMSVPGRGNWKNATDHDSLKYQKSKRKSGGPGISD